MYQVLVELFCYGFVCKIPRDFLLPCFCRGDLEIFCGILQTTCLQKRVSGRRLFAKFRRIKNLCAKAPKQPIILVAGCILFHSTAECIYHTVVLKQLQCFLHHVFHPLFSWQVSGDPSSTVDFNRRANAQGVIDLTQDERKTKKKRKGREYSTNGGRRQKQPFLPPTIRLCHHSRGTLERRSFSLGPQGNLHAKSGHPRRHWRPAEWRTLCYKGVQDWKRLRRIFLRTMTLMPSIKQPNSSLPLMHSTPRRTTVDERISS